jgi:hypothetical protein
MKVWALLALIPLGLLGAAEIRLTAPLEYQVTQRSNRTEGSVVVAGTRKDAAGTRLEIRLTDPQGKGNWQAIDGDGATFSSTLRTVAGGTDIHTAHRVAVDGGLVESGHGVLGDHVLSAPQALRLSDLPAVKFAEWGLVVLLTLHLVGGIRLILIEFGPWKGTRSGWITATVFIAGCTGVLFLYNLVI